MSRSTLAEHATPQFAGGEKLVHITISQTMFLHILLISDKLIVVHVGHVNYPGARARLYGKLRERAMD
jgi:hypothetical protein